jgi:hypothetical protein
MNPLRHPESNPTAIAQILMQGDWDRSDIGAVQDLCTHEKRYVRVAAACALSEVQPVVAALYGWDDGDEWASEISADRKRWASVLGAGRFPRFFIGSDNLDPRPDKIRAYVRPPCSPRIYVVEILRIESYGSFFNGLTFVQGPYQVVSEVASSNDDILAARGMDPNWENVSPDFAYRSACYYGWCGPSRKAARKDPNFGDMYDEEFPWDP